MEEADSSKGYPGWKMDLRVSSEYNAKTEFPTAIHPSCMKDSWPIMVREVAMMLVMDRLSDKPDWHIKVFDDAIADKWRKEALAWPEEDLWNRIDHIERWHPEEEEEEMDEEETARMGARYPKRPKNILDQASVDYCIEELRHKAEHFKKTSIVPTLDASYMAAKSDSLVSPQLQADLKEAFDRLQADQAANPDWHPNTNETVQDLVHPSMYPLVYGRSRFFEGEVVGVEDAIDKWAGKGIVIPKWLETRAQTNVNRRNIEYNFWSDDYQWLPANVKFTDEGGVKFTSYINNLHPVKYTGIYRSLEQLIETALPMWDQCLTHIEKWKFVANGRTEPRIIPEDPDDSNQDHWIPKKPKARKDKQSRRGTVRNWQEAKENSPGEEDLGEEDTEEEEEEEEDEDDRRKGEPVFPPPPPFSKSKVNYDVNPARTLRSMFKDTGLQVIVKMASIELTPEKPEFPAGGWHVEGMMNERIVGTALYYLDSENITESHLEFRTSTENYLDDDSPFDQVAQDGYHWMQSVYGAYFGGGAGQACLQHYGSVLTPQGRMLAFPNIFHHRVSGFKLADPTKPGHRRFIALWLVDPFMRIISTANVPPQQAEWWADLAFRSQAASSSSDSESKVKIPPEMVQLLLEKGLAKEQFANALASGDVASVGRLPPELVEMVRKELPAEELPMSRKEAEEHRLELMKERSGFHENAEDKWRENEYRFCEH